MEPGDELDEPASGSSPAPDAGRAMRRPAPPRRPASGLMSRRRPASSSRRASSWPRLLPPPLLRRLRRPRPRLHPPAPPPRSWPRIVLRRRLLSRGRRLCVRGDGSASGDPGRRARRLAPGRRALGVGQLHGVRVGQASAPARRGARARRSSPVALQHLEDRAHELDGQAARRPGRGPRGSPRAGRSSWGAEAHQSDNHLTR